MHLPFAEWLALEGESHSAPYDKLGSRYSSNPPLFWEKTIDADPQLVVHRQPEHVWTLSQLIEQELEALVKALHWYTGIAPIHPMRSVTYFDPRSTEAFATYPDLEAVTSEHGVQRRYGESEKEYATQNENPTIALRQTDATPLAGMVAFARQTQSVWLGEQYERASQSLGLCSAPGLDWRSQVLLLVGAYESLFLPDRTTELQKGFEQRFSCLTANHAEEGSQYAGWVRFAYRLRSELIHGRPLDSLLKKLPTQPGEYVAAFSRAGVVALCKLIRYRYAHPEVHEHADPLWAALDTVESNPDGFAMLQALIRPAALAPVQYQWEVEDVL